MDGECIPSSNHRFPQVGRNRVQEAPEVVFDLTHKGRKVWKPTNDSFQPPSLSQSITITFENFKSITTTITITFASITSITFYYILLQFGANLRGNFNTEIKLTGYFIHLILLKMLQIMTYKDKISQI